MQEGYSLVVGGVGGVGGWVGGWGSLWELEFLVECLVAFEGVV